MELLDNENYPANKHSINTTRSAQLGVNRMARKARLNRVFSKNDRARYYLKRLSALNIFAPKVSAVSTVDAFVLNSKKVFKQSVAMAALLLVVNSVSAHGYADEYWTANIDDMGMPMQGTIIADNDGYLTKFSPQTGASDTRGMTDKATHVVESGETLSHIASQYGVSEQTIIWENNLANRNSLRVGQSLSIPPVDGVTHTVKKGENLEKVAKLYGVEADLISKQNRLDSIYLYQGQDLIIPGGKQLVPAAPAVIANARTGASRAESSTRSTASSVPLANSAAQPNTGKMFIFPTRGSITQYFRSGHYAYDIADPSRPPIWAAGSGVVEKVSVGTWGGGYGNHVIIDHGNGYKTLYGHMQSVNVTKGQQVSQGQAIGQMGNTGRVYGVTGIHLHFEVRHNGVKENPGSFF